MFFKNSRVSRGIDQPTSASKIIYFENWLIAEVLIILFYVIDTAMDGDVPRQRLKTPR